MARDYVEQRNGGYHVAGSRVPLDSIVHCFRTGDSPESIHQDFPTLSLEQVYGAIAFYLGHQKDVDESIREAEKLWAEFEAQHPVPPELREKLLRAREQMLARRDG